MRNTIKIALAAVMTLAIAACDRGAAPANNTAANEVDANMTMSAPANDASAMESVTNTTTTTTTTTTNDTGTTDGTNAGGDTGGNNVESNTVGM